MSGHSKWSSIKHKKAIVDAKRGKAFTKVAQELTIAAREGGADPVANFRLRLAIQKAREVNMPADNIERAVARGVGGKEGSQLEEIRYEGYGPHGVAIMVDVLTDNRNRTVSVLRSLFTRAGGSLGETNSVAWMFTQKGVINVNCQDKDPADTALQILESVDIDGEIDDDTDGVAVTVNPNNFESTREALIKAGFVIDNAEVTMHPSNLISLDTKQSESIIKLLELLEDSDDVQSVYANADFAEDVL